ncbi:peptidoglycan-binding domain-containing protein [Tunturiibacter lichenicola]|uniref:peptidoglycan-binding domain-containing protein n=1 Tax=Tunturiibacter lichenicola TaxID=2051959 RepID=UPI0021B24406|nr:peptidoglycan-binding domain-containing protein [Edaphobacter lichenicola]
MRFANALSISVLIVATSLPCLALTHAHRGPTSPKLLSKHSKLGSKTTGQHAIDDTRATQIQTSLIKSGYLAGAASGHWDSQTESAMQKFQEDNGWQTKLIPDSRAIIKLGLGPAHTSSTSSTSSTMASPETSSTSSFMQR